MLALMAFAGMALVSGCKQAREKGQEAKQTAKEKIAEKTAKKEPAGEPIKIGAIFSVTGKAAFLGEPEKQTVDMLVEQINKDGGVLGRPLEVVVYDDKGDEQETINAANKLISEKVSAIIGPSRSGNTMAITKLLGDAKIPLVSCAAAEAIVDPTQPWFPWVFKTPQKDSDVVKHILDHMKANKITTIGVIYGNEPFGGFGFEQLKKLAPEYGITIAFNGNFEPTATDEDLKILLTKIKSDSKIQAIVNWTILPAQTSVPKLVKELDIKIPLYHSHGFGNIAWARQAGASADGVIFPAGRLLVANELPDDNPQKANLVQYKKDYEAKYEKDVSTFGGHAYDALKIVVMAIEAAGSDDPAKIREALEGIKFSGTGGNFVMSKTDHNGLGMDALEMLTVKGGEFTLLNK